MAKLFEGLPRYSPKGGQSGTTGGGVGVTPGATPANPGKLLKASEGLKSGISRESLVQNKDFLSASRVMWERNNPGKAFKGSNNELADYGLSTWYTTYNLMATGVDAIQFLNAPAKDKAALAYILRTGDNLEWSMQGFADAGISVLQDPTTYAGLATLGFGTAVGQSAKLIARETLMQAIKSAAIKGAAEGAAWNATAYAIDETLRKNVGISEGPTLGGAAVSAGIGAVAGGALGVGAEALGRAFKKPGTTLADEAAEAAQPSTGKPAITTGTETPPPGVAAEVAPAPVRPANDNIGLPQAANPPAALPSTLVPSNDNEAIPGQQILKQITPDAAPVTPEVRTTTVTPNSVEAATPGIPANDVNPAVKPPPAGVEAILPARAEPPRPANLNGDRTGNKVIDLIRDEAFTDGSRTLPGPYSGLAARTQKAVDELVKMDPKELSKAVEEIRLARTNGQEDPLLDHAITQAGIAINKKAQSLNEAMAKISPNSPDYAIIDAAKQAANTARDILRSADEDLASFSGYNLGQRAGAGSIWKAKLKEITPESIAADEFSITDLARATPEERQKVDTVFYKKIDDINKKIQTEKEVVELSKKINEAYDAGDFAKGEVLAAEKAALEDSLIDKATGGNRGSTLLRGVNEVAISNVFSIKSVMNNTLPSVLKFSTTPIRDYMVSGGPFSMEANRQLIAAYSTMWAARGMMWKAARLNFKLEQALLTNDVNAILEGGTVISKKYGGGIIRLLPRLNGAIDEGFKQLAYRQFAVSTAIQEAAANARKLGLGKADTTALIKKAAKEAVENAFDATPDYATAISTIRRDGTNKGLKGEKLQAYIRQTLDLGDPAVAKKEGERMGLSGKDLDLYVKQKTQGNAALFRKAKLETGKNYANDMTFARQFEGKGKVSALAKGYEGFVNNHPWMRLMGQLFFRTPVRVFEEGFRLTPGLNLVSGVVAGNFLRDLRGLGPGGIRGVAYKRAQGELFMSFGIGLWVMAQYAEGNLTGGGPADWRQKRTLENSKEWQPYTLKTPLGDFNYRNLDPFFTPVKILTNALDKYAELEYRRAQGEYDTKSEVDLVVAHISVASFALTKAITDASLTEGLSQGYNFITDLMDPEANGDQLQKFFAQKAKLAVPATWTNIAKLEGPPMQDPATLGQYWLGALNPNSGSVPTRRNALGQQIEMVDPMSGVTGLSFTTREGRVAKLKNEKSAFVLKELSDLAVAVNTHFELPYTVSFDPGWTGIDLRKTMTSDGKMSLWERYNQILEGYNLEERLYPVLKNSSKLAAGTPGAGGAGPRVQAVRAILSEARRQAWYELTREEAAVAARSRMGRDQSIQSITGKRDVSFKLFQQ